MPSVIYKTTKALKTHLYFRRTWTSKNQPHAYTSLHLATPQISFSCGIFRLIAGYFSRRNYFGFAIAIHECTIPGERLSCIAEYGKCSWKSHPLLYVVQLGQLWIATALVGEFLCIYMQRIKGHSVGRFAFYVSDSTYISNIGQWRHSTDWIY